MILVYSDTSYIVNVSIHECHLSLSVLELNLNLDVATAILQHRGHMKGRTGWKYEKNRRSRMVSEMAKSMVKWSKMPLLDPKYTAAGARRAQRSPAYINRFFYELSNLPLHLFKGRFAPDTLFRSFYVPSVIALSDWIFFRFAMFVFD